MLKIEHLNHSMKKTKIIDDISLELDCGIYGLLGPNGAGKTTLMRCICGIYETKNSITIDGIKVGEKGYHENIGYLPQSFGLFKDMKVIDMLMYMSINKIESDSVAEKSAIEALEKVNLLDRKDSKVKELSGGMIRRLGIANAIMGKPKVLIFDEPTAGLDPEERLRFREIISEFRKDTTVILSTHIVSDVEAICDKVLVMQSGRIKYIGDEGKLETIGAKHSEMQGSMLEKGYVCILRDA